MNSVKVRGLFRLERSDDFDEYLRSVEANSLEALLDSWEVAARRVLLAAGLPDDLRGVIIEPGGAWRKLELGLNPTPADIERALIDQAARGERIGRLDDLIEARGLELTIEYRAAKVLLHAWLLRQAIAAASARQAASNALSLQRHVDAWMATMYWEKPVERTRRRMEANRAASEKAHGSPGEQVEKQAERLKAYHRALADGPKGATARAAKMARCSKRTIERALKKMC